MSLLSVEQLSKSYGDKTLFQDISFTISEKRWIGIIGVNGTGKSTLLKIIAGLESADTGEIIHANDFHIEYLSQTPYFEEGVTVLEAVFYGNSPLMRLLREYEERSAALKQIHRMKSFRTSCFPSAENGCHGCMGYEYNRKNSAQPARHHNARTASEHAFRRTAKTSGYCPCSHPAS